MRTNLPGPGDLVTCGPVVSARDPRWSGPYPVEAATILHVLGGRCIADEHGRGVEHLAGIAMNRGALKPENGYAEEEILRLIVRYSDECPNAYAHLETVAEQIARKS